MKRQPGSRPGYAPFFLTSVLLALACSKEDEPAPVVVRLDAGQEGDAWTQAPAPVEVTLLGLQDGVSSQLARGPFPAERLDLGVLAAGSAWAFRAELRDAAGALVLRGVSPPLGGSVLAGRELPVHCGRVGAFSRPTAGLTSGWRRPALALALDRYLLVAGERLGDDGVSSELYDLAALIPLVGGSPLPRTPRTAAASRSGRALLIDDGGATLLDLSTGESATVVPDLAGDAAGGLVVEDGDGGAFVVGAARSSGSPTGTVLRLDARGTLTRLALQQPRLGAAAAWVDGAGLVVAGGGVEASVELLSPGASAFVATGLLLPATLGAALAPLSAAELVLLGGLAPDQTPRAPVQLSLSCAAGCPAPAPLPFSFEVSNGRSHAVGVGKALVLGDRATGLVTALIEATTEGPRLTEIPLRAPRRDASSLRLPDGRVAVLGGVDEAGAPVRSVELFTPP